LIFQNDDSSPSSVHQSNGAPNQTVEGALLINMALVCVYCDPIPVPFTEDIIMELSTFYFLVYLQNPDMDDLDLLGELFEHQLVPFVLFSPTPAVEIIQALSFAKRFRFFPIGSMPGSTRIILRSIMICGD
jgi:hypothetical protein